jgi:hypothetical protein
MRGIRADFVVGDTAQRRHIPLRAYVRDVHAVE